MESTLFSIPLAIIILGKALSLDYVVKTTSGPVRGILQSWEDMYYVSYFGIPYAESPVEALRFMPPVPRRPWSFILNATREWYACPQANKKFTRDKMNEDCLIININVPANVKEKKLPVFVFVHGEAFRFLSGRSDTLYGPQLILQRGVIFVTMNFRLFQRALLLNNVQDEIIKFNIFFRLGPLGFLSLNIEEASGNAALKDILLALKWIQENIEQFGGDPNKITIGGQSSGSTLVHFLLLTEKSTGLFQQAVLLSGNAVSHRSVSRHAIDNAFTLAKKLGLATDDVRTLLKRLIEIDVFDIIDAEMSMAEDDNVCLRPFAAFIPSIEINSPHAVITSDPVEIIRSGLKQNVPILAGFNYREGIFVIPQIRKDKQRLKDNLELSIPSDIEYPLGSHMSRTLAKSIGQNYFESDLTNFTPSNIVDLSSDSQYIFSTHSWIDTLKKHDNSNALYYYIFDFDGDINWAKIYYDIDFPGTAHADELGYIFITEKTRHLLKNVNHRSRLVMDIFMTFISNFIKFGNPTTESSSKFRWPDYGKNKTVVFINDNPHVGTLPKQLMDRLSFWYDVYDKYNSYVKNDGVLEKKFHKFN